MKYYLSIIFSFIAVHCLAQENGYADFIQNDNKIQWAAWYDQILEITPRIKKYGIRQILYRQMQQKEIDKYVAEKNGDVNIQSPGRNLQLPSDTLEKDFNPYKHYLYNGYPGNESDFIINEKNCSCTGDASTNKFDIYKIRQVIYYKRSKLYVKNILVTPLCLKNGVGDYYNDSFKFVWQSSFASCYNLSEDSISAVKKKTCIDLGNSEQLYDFRFKITGENNKVNPYLLKNPLFSYHLYEDIVNNRLTVVDYQNKVIPNNKVIEYGNETINVPVYDSTGEQTGIHSVRYEVNIDSFYEFAINQHFFFDTTNRILYSEVNYVEVYKRVITAAGIDLGNSVFYRVYFVKPSFYKKPVSHKFLN